MDTQRLFLFLIFSISLVLVWDGWQRFQHPQEVTQQSISQAQSASIATTSMMPGTALDKNINDTPSSTSTAGKTIIVKTDTLNVEISTLGGDIQRLSFLQHADVADKTKPFVLLERGRGTHGYVAQTGLLGAGLPTHNSMFSAEKEQYELGATDERLDVRLSAVTGSGVKVAKILTFHKASYLIDVSYEIQNDSTTAI